MGLIVLSVGFIYWYTVIGFWHWFLLDNWFILCGWTWLCWFGCCRWWGGWCSFLVGVCGLGGELVGVLIGVIRGLAIVSLSILLAGWAMISGAGLLTVVVPGHL